jgi:hypothetical protein
MKKKAASHENFTSRTDIKVGSNRSFGLVFTAVFLLIALAPLFKYHDIRWWALGIAAFILVIALKVPEYLAPFNRVWFRFGMLLHKVVGPVMLGATFFVIFSPIAMILRALGKGSLSLKFDPKAPSYWIERAPPGPLPKSMTQQF